MSQKIFDIEGSLDRVDGDRELLSELIDIFFEEYNSQKLALQEAVSNLNFEQVEGCAHAMKSALGNIGAARAFEQAFTVEKMGKQRTSEDLAVQVQILFEGIDEFETLARQFQSEQSGS